MIGAFKNYRRYNIATRPAIPGDKRREVVAKAKSLTAAKFKVFRKETLRSSLLKATRLDSLFEKILHLT